ncbi:MAG: hypothetical protein WCI34_04790 [Actinomycetes bacterium]
MSKRSSGVLLFAMGLTALGCGGTSGPTGEQTACISLFNSAVKASATRVPITSKMGEQMMLTTAGNPVKTAKVAVARETGISSSCLITVQFAQNSAIAEGGPGRPYFQYTFPDSWAPATDPWASDVEVGGPFEDAGMYDNVRKNLAESKLQLAVRPASAPISWSNQFYIK